MTDDEVKVTKSARKMTDMMTVNNDVFKNSGSEGGDQTHSRKSSCA